LRNIAFVVGLCLASGFSCARAIPSDTVRNMQPMNSCIDPNGDEPHREQTCASFCEYAADNRWLAGWSPWVFGDVQGFREGLDAGAVVVTKNDDSYEPVPECNLERRFLRVDGAPGSAGDVFVSTRVLVRPAELGPECSGGTHAVVAYSVGRGAKSSADHALLVPLPCQEGAGDFGCRSELVESGPAFAKEFDRVWGPMLGQPMAGSEISELLTIYSWDASTAAPLLAKYLATTRKPISCFIAAEAQQQVDDPDGRPIEWTDPDLQGCAALPPFDVCFPDSFRPARLEADQCPELQPTPLRDASEP